MLHRFVLAVALVALLGGSVGAIEPESLTQMTLAQSAQFRLRLQYMLLQESVVVKAEPNATMCHSARSLYANHVLTNAAQAAADAAALIAGGVNLIGTVVPNAIANLVDSSASDAAIRSQIATYWNVMSKCDTGS